MSKNTIAYVDIGTLTPTTRSAPEFSGGEFYIPLRAAETRCNRHRATIINGKQNAAWFHHLHDRIEVAHELGLRFLDDITVSGHSYTSRDGMLITDGSTSGETAVQFAAQEKEPFAEFVGSKELINHDGLALVITGPGHFVWGHWLIDFLPRLALAQTVFGRAIENIVIPVPSDTPEWAYRFAEFFCGIRKDKFLPFDRGREAVFCKRACIPTFTHNIGMHSMMLEFYTAFRRTVGLRGPAKICVSRRKMEKKSLSVLRVFEQQQYFELYAQKRGYVIVCPENLSMVQQVDIFSNAQIIVGEYGSGMHNAIFSNPDTIVGQFCFPNVYQSRISALCQHRSVFLLPDSEEADQNGVLRLNVSNRAIDAFFAVVEPQR